MIKSLFLSNIFLFEEEEIFFINGLNIITGETGSGKTNIIKALLLILGARTDTDIIRGEKAVLEGKFEVENIKRLNTVLKDDQLEIESKDITIRRELYKNGKNRIFINDCLCNISTLKKISSFLIEIVSQNFSHKLLYASEQMELLDKFSNLEERVLSFAKDYNLLNQTEKKLDQLLINKKDLEEKKRVLNLEKAFIEEVDLKKDELILLEQEYKILKNSEEILQKTGLITNLLSENENAILPILKSFEKTLNELIKLDPSFKEAMSLFKTGYLEIEEVSNFLLNYNSKTDLNGKRLEEIEIRLNDIYKLLKRYVSFENLQKEHKNILDELDGLQNIDSDIELHISTIKTLSSKVESKADEISKLRRKNAILLKEKVLLVLRELNMPSCSFEIEISKSDRGSNGDDAIEFLFSANAGMDIKPLNLVASGGELSRVMLAIKTALQEKEGACLIFDEIDSNVGGKSATIIGQKLKELSKTKQIIIITHFVQVAKFADRHLLMYKNENEKAVSKLKELDNISKENEYQRMVGIS